MTDDTSNRDRILEAAEALFAQKGFAATSVREIVRAADVTNPMLYYYFGSKHELFSTCCASDSSCFATSFAEALSPQDSVGGLLRQYMTLFLHKTIESPTTTRFVYASFWGPREGVPVDVILEMHGVLTEVIRSALRRVAPDVPEDRLLFALLMFHGTMNNLVGPFMEGWVREIPEALVDAVVERVTTIVHDDRPIPEGLETLLGLGCTETDIAQVAE